MNINWHLKSKSPLLISLALILIVTLVSPQKEIDTFNILLPQIHQNNQGRPVELITAQGGCFSWQSSSPQLISVEGLPSDQANCIRKGLLSLKHIGPYSGSLLISATNIKTQELITIPVRIRPISRIQIIAKSRMININEVQDLNIFAYDQQKNMFTSLEGLKFEWQLIENSGVLSKISLKNSHLILPLDQRKNIEKKGSESDIIVIKGERPGKALIRVRCTQPGYQNLQHQITISVHQRFDIVPSLPTYMMVNTSYKFGLQTPTRQVISIPKPYYKISFATKSFSGNQHLLVNAPKTQDETELKVQDIRTSPPYSSQVKVYAKEPDQIRLKVSEYMVVGITTNVKVQYYWKGNLLVGSQQPSTIKTNLPFNSRKSQLTALKKEVGTIRAEYGKLFVEKTVNMILPLKVVLPGKKLVLPLRETFQLNVVGGSGFYQYSIDSAIAVISSTGSITTKKQGKASIVVFDKKINQNYVTIQLIVSPVSVLIPLQAQKELNINEEGPIFIIGQTKQNQQFTKCSEQPVSLQISHLSHFELLKSANFQKGLGILKQKIQQSAIVKGKVLRYALVPDSIQKTLSQFSEYINSGDASAEDIRRYIEEIQNYGVCSIHMLKSYRQFDNSIETFFTQNLNVRGKFSLRVYEKIANEVSKQILDSFIMTPLSTLLWKTSGGSYEWNDKTKIFINSVQQSAEAEIPLVSCPDKQAVLELKMQKRNIETDKLLLPVSQIKTMYVQCKYPSTLKLQFDKENHQASLVNALKGQLIKGTLIPFDSKGQVFYNSSNLIYKYNTTSGTVKSKNNIFQFDSQHSLQAKVYFWSQNIQRSNTGFNRISAQFTYFVKQMFELSPIIKQGRLLTLYNPKSTYQFNLTKLSENAEINCNGSISCQFAPSKESIRWNTTRVGKGMMIIRQKSIYGFPTLVINFQVVEADQIILEVPLNSLQVHRSMIAEVKIYYNKLLIPSWQYDFRNLILTHDGGVRSKQVISTSGSNNKYQIFGQKPGNYRITVEQRFPIFLQSRPVKFAVYDKITTNVPNLEATYQNEVLLLKGQINVAVNCLRKVNILGGPSKIYVTDQTSNTRSLQLRYVGDSFRQIHFFGMAQSQTQVKLLIAAAGDKQSTIAVVFLKVNIKPITDVKIYTLGQALINAQFRSLAHLIIDDKIVLDSVCQLYYKWTSNSNLKLTNAGQKQFGINTTAIQEGKGIIQLRISDSKGEELFAKQSFIKIHKSLDLQVPTIIGQQNSGKSTNLLIPPSSGYTFTDSNIYIKKISECEDNVLSIQGSKIQTSREKGMVSIKIQKQNDTSYNNYLNVIITEIKALFLENSFNSILVEEGKVKQVKFYVEDMYGRLFYNNLINIEYDVVSSNQDIFTAEIDSSKNFVTIHPKNSGSAQLLLKLKTSQSHKIDAKLLEIPHDIVNVQVGKIIEPHSPIYLVKGGVVSLQYKAKSDEKWRVIEGQQNVQIYPKQKQIRAMREGQAKIQIGENIVIIRVITPILRKKVLSNFEKTNKVIIQYIVTGKWNDQLIYIPSIQNEHNHINNNLALKCVTGNNQWFKASTYVKKQEQGDALVCEIERNYEFDNHAYVIVLLNLQMPKVLQAIVEWKENVPRLHIAQLPIQSLMWIPKEFKTINLSEKHPEQEITIKSRKPLQTTVVGGSDKWIQQSFDQQETHIIKIKINKQEILQNTMFTLNVYSKFSGQSEKIKVKYGVHDSNEETHQEQQDKKDEKESQKKEQDRKDSQNATKWLQGWHWTDFLILVMGIMLIGILIYQSCSNEAKYKVL